MTKAEVWLRLFRVFIENQARITSSDITGVSAGKLADKAILEFEKRFKYDIEITGELEETNDPR